jgi:mRNA interferase RelE/StbE
MGYRLVYVKSVKKDVDKLDGVTHKRIKKKIESFLNSPLKYASKLISPALGTYRWRIGNYRIVFDLDGKTIIVLKIKHHREIYR